MSLPDYVLKGTRRAAVGLFGRIQILSGRLQRTVANGLVASTTQTRAGGLALTAEVCVVATVANSGDAVTLAALNIGESQDIYNAGANPMKVFPNGASDTIDGGAAAASVTLTNASRCRFTMVAANTIISAKLGAVSS